MREAVTTLLVKVDQARVKFATDPAEIDRNIKALATDGRSFINALARLQQAGESIVPPMIDYLRDTRQSSLHGSIRRALVRIGRPLLNPLVAAMEMKDPQTLVNLADILAELGEPDSIPYLLRAVQDPAIPAAAKDSINKAIARMGSDPASINAGASLRCSPNASTTTPPRSSPTRATRLPGSGAGMRKRAFFIMMPRRASSTISWRSDPPRTR